VAEHGVARQRKAGEAGLGGARLGMASLDEAWQGKAG